MSEFLGAIRFPRDHRFSIREWNRASTRVRLARALLELLGERAVADIPVQELCDAAAISPGTFFNQFPRKSDLVIYLTQLIQIDVAHAAAQRSTPGLSRIEGMFDRTAELMVQHPWGMGEIISAQASLRQRPQLPEISPAERAVAFPDLAVDDIPSGILLREAFELELTRAAARREIPHDTEIASVAQMLHCIYFGVPFGTWMDTAQVGQHYERLVQLLWSSLRCERPAA
jgi:AcrR family transcriptional regulator